MIERKGEAKSFALSFLWPLSFDYLPYNMTKHIKKEEIVAKDKFFVYLCRHITKDVTRPLWSVIQ